VKKPYCCECGHCKRCWARAYYQRRRGTAAHARKLLNNKRNRERRKTEQPKRIAVPEAKYHEAEWIERRLALIDRLKRRTRWQEIVPPPVGTESAPGSFMGENPVVGGGRNVSEA
jgi:hypothetical protein